MGLVQRGQTVHVQYRTLGPNAIQSKLRQTDTVSRFIDSTSIQQYAVVSMILTDDCADCRETPTSFICLWVKDTPPPANESSEIILSGS